MVTWIGRLCVLCAVSTLMQMIMPASKARESLHMICGLLMLHLTFSCLKETAGSIAQGDGFMDVLESLLR